MRSRGYLCAVVLLLIAFSASAAKPAKCVSPAPNAPHVIISYEFPQDVCLPKEEVPGIPFFDDFSWRSFIALIWPARPPHYSGERGSPERTQQPGTRDKNNGPPV